VQYKEIDIEKYTKIYNGHSLTKATSNYPVTPVKGHTIDFQVSQTLNKTMKEKQHKNLRLEPYKT